MHRVILLSFDSDLHWTSLRFRILSLFLFLAENKELNAKLVREQEEVQSLRRQLAELTESQKAEADHLVSEKTRLEEEMEELRTTRNAAERKVLLAEQAAQRFQAHITAWTSEFKKVQAHMHGKLNFRILCFVLVFYRNIDLHWFHRELP